LYRFYKSKGLHAEFGNNKKASVTHLFRHLNGLDSSTLKDGVLDSKKYLGHVNINNTLKYVKNFKK
jgi:hypothetical protein